MKKYIITALILCSSILVGFAQRKTEITPFVGYMFGSNVQTGYGKLHFDDNVQYGAILSFATRFVDLDLLYSRQDTKANFNNFYGYPDYYGTLDDLSLSFNYFQIGATKHIHMNGNVAPFIGANIGACLISPENLFDDVWRFSVGAHLGAKVYLTNRVGLRLQAQMLVPIQSAGLVFSVGTGGAGAGIDFESTLLQFGLNAGLIIRL